jgi:predicted  nucleic acid-binding Zn-ribbon protein
LGFLERFFGKKEEKELELSLGELEAWLERRVKEREDRAVEELVPQVEEVFDAREAAREIVKELGDYEFPADLKKRVYKPVLTSKPAYVKAMLDALGSISSRQPRSYEDLKGFHASTLRAMKTIEKVQLGKGRYLMVTFREEMLKIGSALNRIVDALKGIGEGLEEAEREISRIRNLIAKSRELKAKLELVNSPPETSAEEKKLEKEKKILEEKYRSLLESRAYREHMQLEEKLEELRKQKSLLRSRVINSLGPFQRSFRKFKKLVADGVVKYSDPSTLESYLHNPAEAFASESEGCEGIKLLLQSLEEAVKTGTLRLGKKEREKVLSKIKTETRELPELRRNLRKLEKDEAGAAARLRSSKIAEEKEALKRELLDLERKLQRLREEKKTKTEEAAKLKAETLKLAAEIRAEIEELAGRKVRVVLPS